MSLFHHISRLNVFFVKFIFGITGLEFSQIKNKSHAKGKHNEVYFISLHLTNYKWNWFWCVIFPKFKKKNTKPTLRSQAQYTEFCKLLILGALPWFTCKKNKKKQTSIKARWHWKEKCVHGEARHVPELTFFQLCSRVCGMRMRILAVWSPVTQTLWVHVLGDNSFVSHLRWQRPSRRSVIVFQTIWLSSLAKSSGMFFFEFFFLMPQNVTHLFNWRRPAASNDALCRLFIVL